MIDTTKAKVIFLENLDKELNKIDSTEIKLITMFSELDKVMSEIHSKPIMWEDSAKAKAIQKLNLEDI